jgi:ribokinase
MTPRVGVVGHIEWAEFLVVEAVPLQGSITHVTDHFEVAAGGGAVAAVGLAELAGGAIFLTAIGEDALGARAVDELRGRGVTVHACVHPGRDQRRVITFLDGGGERTIVIVGERLVPLAADALPWEVCEELDGVYFTASGDPEAARWARKARVMVASSRAANALADVVCDVVVCSALDPDEMAWAQEIEGDVKVFTEGVLGGRWEARDGSSGRWQPVPPPGPPRDSYGCGDNFAAGLTYGLASGRPLGEALALAAERGALVATRRGPYA